MNRRMLGGSFRFLAVSISKRPSISSSSKLCILRRSVDSETPVSLARSATESPKRTGWRIRSYSTCSGHQHSGNSSCQSSVCSTRGRFAAMRSPSIPGGAWRASAPAKLPAQAPRLHPRASNRHDRSLSRGKYDAMAPGSGPSDAANAPRASPDRGTIGPLPDWFPVQERRLCLFVNAFGSQVADPARSGRI